MAYADFPYYQDFYLGSMIRDPTAFGRAAERASEYLDMVTLLSGGEEGDYGGPADYN